MYEGDIRVLGTVVASGLGVASTGTEQLAVCFEYTDEGGNPHRINWYGYFSSEKAIEIADKALCALGWDPVANEFKYHELNGEDPKTNPLIGRRAQLVLGKEEDSDGQGWRWKVKFVNSAGGGLGLRERMSPEDAAAFSAKMRARMGGAAPAQPRPRPSAAAAPTTRSESPAARPPAQQRPAAAPKAAPAPAAKPAPAPAPQDDFSDVPF